MLKRRLVRSRLLESCYGASILSVALANATVDYSDRLFSSLGCDDIDHDAHTQSRPPYCRYVSRP